MRAALGLSLLFGGSVLALYILSGRVPFAATSAASGGTAQLSAAPHVIGSVVDQGVGSGPSGPSGPSGGGLP